MRRTYKYNIGDKILCNNGTYSTIIEKSTGHRNASSYICKCNNGHLYNKLQTKINSSCPYCTNILIEKGINDISTTNKKMFDMLVDKNFGYTHCDTSQEKTNFICENCKKIIYTSPYSVKHYGLRCPNCHDGFSYGEKFISTLLTEIDIPYIYQYTSKYAEWCGNYKYDFYIPSVDCIIEVQGLQHYADCSWCNYETVHSNDLEKKKIAKDHVKYYVQLDVRKSTLNYIRTSILRSELDDILQLYFHEHEFSWKHIHEKALSSILYDIVDKYNTYTDDVSELSKLFKISKTTIVSYLKNGANLGMCDYNPKKKISDTLIKNHSKNSERGSKPIMCIDDGNVFRNAKLLETLSVELYGKNMFMDSRNISAMCNGRQKSVKKHHFKFISRCEFNNIKNKFPEKAYGDLFEILEV